jgi:hypothetical protein
MYSKLPVLIINAVKNRGIITAPASGYCAKGTNSVPLMFKTNIIPYQDVMIILELGPGLITPGGWTSSVKITT